MNQYLISPKCPTLEVEIEVRFRASNKNEGDGFLLENKGDRL